MLWDYRDTCTVKQGCGRHSNNNNNKTAVMFLSKRRLFEMPTCLVLLSRLPAAGTNNHLFIPQQNI